ncbi:hypothetical protein [Psychroserpens mesophilus]|uniref:hypothetical protein n=1 Tax=Psychroserpens mesophilus TaxID=325473 RepID=UPI003D65BDCD
MAHKLLKPYSFLLYILAIITFFFIGITVAGLVDAGKNQGLAGGAIVLGYAVISSLIGLIISFFVANKTNRQIVFRLNVILALSIVSFFAYYQIKYQKRQKAKMIENHKTKQPKQQTSSATNGFSFSEPIAILNTNNTKTQTKLSGLGMFTPNLNENDILYFYGNPYFKSSLSNRLPTDSLTFKSGKYGGYNIALAPPWLVPEHLKLDYGILYFKAISITKEFVEIEVNTLTNQTAYVNIMSGKLMYWPEFLLDINSIEFLNSETQKVFVKPLEHAGIVNEHYSFMRPLKVKQNWMYVELLTDNFNSVGKGWVKWIHDGKLLIHYSLLS